MGVIVAIVAAFYWLTPRVAQQDAVVRTYAPLVEVEAAIQQHFVEPVEEQELVDGAIRGMMLQLDPYSRYIPPEEFDAFDRSLSANYDGIGVTIGMQHGQITVIAPVEGSPAARAGILAEDVILAIDDQVTRGLSVFDANALLVGKPGTTVALTVRRPGTGQTETIAVARGSVAIQPIKGVRRIQEGGHDVWDFLLDGERGIGYVRVVDFRENTALEFDRALSTLTAQGARGLIIDLRFNGGGLLPRAVEMVDRLVADGDIVSIKGRKDTVQRFRAKREGTLEQIEVAVLVNGSTASAAEIVAGALQDKNRAVIVGSRTFGKGSIQRERHFRVDGRRAALRLTEGYYVLPSGRIIHRTPRNGSSGGWGVTPDVRVEVTEQQRQEIQQRRRELDAADPVVPTTMPTTAVVESGTRVPMTAPVGPTLWVDPQLAAAVGVVRERLGDGRSVERTTRP
jgi:carboxyl-terminal processing protease